MKGGFQKVNKSFSHRQEHQGLHVHHVCGHSSRVKLAIVAVLMLTTRAGGGWGRHRMQVDMGDLKVGPRRSLSRGLVLCLRAGKAMGHSWNRI
jgi:hypothetical protein